MRGWVSSVLFFCLLSPTSPAYVSIIIVEPEFVVILGVPVLPNRCQLPCLGGQSGFRLPTLSISSTWYSELDVGVHRGFAGVSLIVEDKIDSATYTCGKHTPVRRCYTLSRAIPLTLRYPTCVATLDDTPGRVYLR